jgi:hypothetical protein
MKTLRRRALGLVALLALIPLAQAAEVPISVPNFSFEDTGVSNGGASPSVALWTEVLIPNGNSLLNTVDPTTNLTNQIGDQYARISLSGTTGRPPASLTALSDVITDGGSEPITFQANTIYTLTVSLAVSGSDTSGGFRYASFGFYNAATNVVIHSTALMRFSTLSTSAFSDRVLVLDTSLSEFSSIIGSTFQLGLHAEDVGNTNGTRYAYFDHVRLTSLSTIPEPSSWAILLGGAALGFVVLRRRRA